MYFDAIWHILYRLTKYWESKASWKIRYFILKLAKVDVGKGTVIKKNVSLEYWSTLKLGKQVSINEDCFISAFGGVKIGDYCAIGHSTTILSSEHDYAILPGEIIKHKELIPKRTEIGRNVWIGARVLILAGVRICDDVVIGGGSVVKHSIYESGVYGGVPARKLKDLGNSIDAAKS